MKKQDNSKEQEPYSLKKFVIDVIEVVVSAIILTILCLIFFHPCIVSGRSMLPTYQNEDVLMVWKLGDIERNDIIAFNSNNPENELYVKRVIAVAGDHLVIKDSTVYINGEIIEEPYINETVFVADVDTVIEDGHIYVLGDNRNHSTDSRAIGQVDLDDVLGKVFINFNKTFRNLFQK